MTLLRYTQEIVPPMPNQHTGPNPIPRLCAYPDCQRLHVARGWCRTHYSRWYKRGTLVVTPPPTMEERFWSKTERGEGCWLWRGNKSFDGYGIMSYGYHHTLSAHRFAYELLVGAIPAGLQIDHLCRNRGCVNPEHLEPVTSRENNVRSIAARKREREAHHA